MDLTRKRLAPHPAEMVTGTLWARSVLYQRCCPKSRNNDSEQDRISKMRPTYQQSWSKSTPKQLTSEFGDWLGKWNWTHFATLTFALSATEGSGRAQFLRWIRRLQQRSGGPVGWFYAFERGLGGSLHLHALLEAPLPAKAAQAAWSAGRAEVVPYDRDRGARYYIAKDIWTSGLDYDMHLPFPAAA
jgi:hypothetical protein